MEKLRVIRELAWISRAALMFVLTVFGSTVRGQTRGDGKEQRDRKGTCREERVPLTIRGAISLARIEVNGKAMAFIVDSAGTSMLNSDRVRLRVVEQRKFGTVTISETVSMEAWDVVEIRWLKLGTQELKDVRILSRSLPQLERQLGGEVDGILGADLLTRWDAVALDYKDRTMRLGKAKCDGVHEEASQASQKSLGFPVTMSLLARQ